MNMDHCTIETRVISSRTEMCIFLDDFHGYQNAAGNPYFIKKLYHRVGVVNIVYYNQTLIGKTKCCKIHLFSFK